MDNVVSTYQPPSSPSPESGTSEDQGVPTSINEKIGSTEVSKNTPLDVYARETHKRFSIEAFDLGEDYANLPSEIQQNLDTIDSYVRDRIEADKLEPTTDSYRQVTKDLKRELGITKNTSHEQILDKIEGYIDCLNIVKSLSEINPKDIAKYVKGEQTKQGMVSKVMKLVEKYVI